MVAKYRWANKTDIKILLLTRQYIDDKMILCFQLQTLSTLNRWENEFCQSIVWRQYLQFNNKIDDIWLTMFILPPVWYHAMLITTWWAVLNICVAKSIVGEINGAQVSHQQTENYRKLSQSVVWSGSHNQCCPTPWLFIDGSFYFFVNTN